MSILVVQALYEGLIFGADRNVTATSIKKTDDGKVVYVLRGQSQRQKVLRWPNYRAIIGYVGAATLRGIPTDEWIYDFIGRNLNFSDFKELAHHLRDEVQTQRIIDEEDSKAEPLIIHLAGFEEREHIQVPVIWFITNSHRLDPNGVYADIKKEFGVSEELWQERYILDSTPHTIRDFLGKRAKAYNPHWFHQGVDLVAFNTFDHFLRQSFRSLIESGLNRPFPTTLDEWGKHLSMSILTYGAYFQSFYDPSAQYVGGGVDIVSLPWPS
jgi:hypothetical protein